MTRRSYHQARESDTREVPGRAARARRGSRARWLLIGGLAACAAPASPRAPAPAAPQPAPAPALPRQVWAREAGLALAGSAPGRVPFIGTRLEVLEASPDSFRVRCPTCPGAPAGWVSRARLAWEATSPAAARQRDLADFVLAVRHAAERREWEAIRAVMAPTFVHSISAPEGPLAAIGAWRTGRAGELARLPALLDRGVTLVPGTSVWAAPPEFVTLRGYQDLRAGFLRGPHGWEWIFLVRGEL